MKLKFTTLMMLLLLTAVLHGQGYQEALKIGSAAPDFEGVDQHQNRISLDGALQDGRSAVVIFYRGNWCPFCRRHVSLLEDSLQYVLEANASVIIVTPETEEAIEDMVDETGATISIVHDAGYTIMKDYQVDYVISEETVTKWLGPVTKRTAVSNGNDDGVLPVPATYIIDPGKKIKWVHFDPKYAERSSVYQILQNLN